ncbi:MAG: hypothetical protein LBJ67_06155, partial [Planctomycetaceae bacterium]|nr:hypothetical protein [Planctomycetaceae bacterium]
MFKHVTTYFIIGSVCLLTIILTDTLYAEEPKTFQDFINNWGEYSDETECPYVCRILENSRRLPCWKAFASLGDIDEIGSQDSPFFCYLVSNKGTSFNIETFVVSSRMQAQGSMLGFISSDTYRLTSYSQNRSLLNIRRGFDRQPGVSRFFLKVKYRDDLIGNFSFDKRYGGFEGHKICEINFLRGNTIISVFSPFSWNLLINRDNQQSLSALRDTDLSDSPDPREIAWRIDQYLKGDPLEKVNNEEKQKLKTLEITLPKDIEFEQGKEYPLDFPRKLFDETVPAEIRLVVSRGEIQQV